MILAFKRLKNLGWVALVFIVIISLYPLSLSVGALRSNLERTETDIVKVKKELRYLETEFATRASMQQLEQWNHLEYGYTSPTADQFLEGERALANVGNGHEGIKKPVRVAALTIDGMDPAGIIGSPYGDGVDIDASSAGSATKNKEDSKSDKADVPKPELTDEQKAAKRRAEFAQQMDVKLLTPAPQARNGQAKNGGNE